MSIQALAWAFEQEIYSTSHKFVLVALANFSSDQGRSYPAVGTISQLTSQSDPTVRKALAALVAGKYIVDTGLKYGPTQQVRVYQFPPEACIRTPKKWGLPKNQESLGISDEDQTKAKGRLNEDPKILGATLEPVTMNQEGKGVKPAAPSRFSKPTVEQVIQRGKEIGLPEQECRKFWDYYESKGWKVGNVSMKVWTCAVANWKRGWEERNKQPILGYNFAANPNYLRPSRPGDDVPY